MRLHVYCWYTLIELNSQYASEKAVGFLATKVLQSAACWAQTESLSHQSWSISAPQKSVLMICSC